MCLPFKSCANGGGIYCLLLTRIFAKMLKNRIKMGQFRWHLNCPRFLALATGAEPVVRFATSPHFRHLRDLIRCVAPQPRPPSSLHRKQSGSAPSEIRVSLLFCFKKSPLHYCTRDLGSRNWARTSDPLINSQMLCRLSYARIFCF